MECPIAWFFSPEADLLSWKSKHPAKNHVLCRKPDTGCFVSLVSRFSYWTAQKIYRPYYPELEVSTDEVQTARLSNLCNQLHREQLHRRCTARYGSWKNFNHADRHRKFTIR